MRCSTNDFIKNYEPTPQVIWVRQVFNDIGNFTFMDLAANHPIHQSNTYALEQLGWKGVCIDANTQCIKLLKKLRSCTVLNTVVSRKQEYVNFTYKGEMGGIVNKKYDNSDSNEESSSIKAHSLQSLLKSLKLAKIDYLSLDVEGAEEDILTEEFDWSDVFRAITIERPSPRLCQRLFRRGYLYAGSVGDAAFIHISHPQALIVSKNETFKYPVAKCRNHNYRYKDRIPLKGDCKSIFGCCSFPGFPPDMYNYNMKNQRKIMSF